MASTQPEGLSTVPSAIRVIATNEKVTGPPGLELLRRLCSTPPAQPWTILDNATGGVVMVSLMLSMAERHLSRIVAGDKDERMLDHIRKRSEDSSWSDVEVKHIDQTEIPYADASFDCVTSNFGIFFHPDDDKTLAETYRVLKFEGRGGITSWKSIAWWPGVAIPAVTKFLPDAPALPPTLTVFPAKGWSDAESIPPKLKKAGFVDVEVTEYAFTPDVEAEDFAEATAVLVGVVASKVWSKDDVDRFGPGIEGAILKYLKETFDGGKWDGQMIALITTGKKQR